MADEAIRAGANQFVPFFEGDDPAPILSQVNAAPKRKEQAQHSDRGAAELGNPALKDMAKNLRAAAVEDEKEPDQQRKNMLHAQEQTFR